MTTPHIHAEYIKAWADGVEIEYLCRGEWLPVLTPSWCIADVYRVKPTPPAPIAQWLIVNKNGHVLSVYSHRSEASEFINSYKHELMRLEIDPATFTATCVLEDV